VVALQPEADEDDDAGAPDPGEQIESFEPLAGLCEHLHVGPLVDQQGEAGTDHRERIHQDDAQLPAGGRRGCLGGWTPAHLLGSGRTRVPPTIRCGIGPG
jgi:hypothetical protein